MVYPPRQTLTVRDGGLGLPAFGVALPLVIGQTTSGVANTLYQFGNPNTMKDTLVGGPALELGLSCIDPAGGVMVLKTAASTAASNGSVTKTAVAGGTGTGTVTVAGTARDSYEVQVAITTTGTVATGKFKYSLDDGYTFSEILTIPAGTTYVIPGTGLTITFVVGGGPVFFELGDLHEFDCVAAHYTTSDIATAITALLAQIGNRDIRRIGFAGRNASGAGAATMAAAIATHMATLAANGYYARAMLDGGKDPAATVKSAFTSFADSRVAVTFGTCDKVTVNSFAGWGVPNRPILDTVFERAAGADLSENLGRKESGSLRGVRAISDDERVNLAFAEGDKITTLRTHLGAAGFYVTNGFLKSAVGSDFKYWDYGLVIDALCKIITTEQDKWLLKKVRVKTDGSGSIDDRDAARVEAAVRNAVKTGLMDPVNVEGFKGHLSGVSYTVDRTTDMLTTAQLTSAGSAVPLPPIEGVLTQVGFARSVV